MSRTGEIAGGLSARARQLSRSERLVVFQICFILLSLGLAAAVVLWTYAVESGRQSRQMEALHRVESSLVSLLSDVAPFMRHLQQTDAQESVVAVETRHRATMSMGRLEAALEEARVVAPHLFPVDGSLAASMRELSKAIRDLAASTTRETQLGAITAFMHRAQVLLLEIRAVDFKLVKSYEAATDRLMRVLVFAGSSSLLVYLVTAGLALQRGRRSRLEQLERETHLMEAFEAIRNGRELPSAVIASDTPLSRALERLRESVLGLVANSHQEREQATFSQGLIEALELDDTPDDVFRTTGRAASIHFPDVAFHLLVADNSGALLEHQVAQREGICAAVTPRDCPAIRKGRMMSFDPGGGLTRCGHLCRKDTFAICASVSAAGQAFAVAQAAWTGEASRPDLAMRLSTLAAAVGARLSIVRTLEERELQASTDPLTGLYNRRAMSRKLADLERQQLPYTLIAADLDHFKRLNDTYGHEVGDRCLKVFSQVLREALRAHDFVCRLGGEEFVAVLPRIGSQDALNVAQRVHFQLAAATRTVGPSFTVSLGVAACPEHASEWQAVLRCADRALYAAKEAGRNQTAVAESDEDGSEESDPVALQHAPLAS